MIPVAAVTSYASQLAGRPVTIACHRDQSFKDDVLGYTLFDDSGYVYPVIYLPASTCNRLNKLASPHRYLVADTRKGACGRVDRALRRRPPRWLGRRHADPRGHAHPRAVHRRGARRVRLVPEPLERREAVPPVGDRGQPDHARHEGGALPVAARVPEGLLALSVAGAAPAGPGARAPARLRARRAGVRASAS